jgi:hypothetical protein
MFFDRRPILTPIPGGQTKQLSVAGCFIFSRVWRTRFDAAKQERAQAEEPSRVREYISGRRRRCRLIRWSASVAFSAFSFAPPRSPVVYFCCCFSRFQL